GGGGSTRTPKTSGLACQRRRGARQQLPLLGRGKESEIKLSMRQRSLRLCAVIVLTVGLLFSAGAASATAAGKPVAWGCEGFGVDSQCGVPGGLSGVTAIAAGDVHSLALKGDGTVVAWGCVGPGNFGQCSVPSGLSGVTAVAAAWSHSLALKGDGTVVA